MSFTTHNGDIQRQPGLAPSALAVCITLALLPSTSLAAPAEETVIVEGYQNNDASNVWPIPGRRP